MTKEYEKEGDEMGGLCLCVWACDVEKGGLKKSFFSSYFLSLSLFPYANNLFPGEYGYFDFLSHALSMYGCRNTSEKLLFEFVINASLFFSSHAPY